MKKSYITPKLMIIDLPEGDLLTTSGPEPEQSEVIYNKNKARLWVEHEDDVW